MVKSDWPANWRLPFAAPGLKFILAGVIAVCALLAAGWIIAGFAALLTTGFVFWFFRDPERVVPDAENALVSPADGRILCIEKAAQGEYVKKEALKVSIFMNVFNVHVNRIPFDGQVEQIKYTPGKFFNASFDKSSMHNERNALLIRTASGTLFTVVQVAGLIARRIVCKTKEGSRVKRGDRYGMICFGSRLDLYLPVECRIAVSKGQHVKAGSTVLGYLKSLE